MADNSVTSDGEGKKKKKCCHYRKGKKHSKYSMQDKARVIAMIESGTKTCEIVRKTGIPESTIRSIKQKKEDIKVCVNTAKKFFSGNVSKPSAGRCNQHSAGGRTILQGTLYFP